MQTYKVPDFNVPILDKSEKIPLLHFFGIIVPSLIIWCANEGPLHPFGEFCFLDILCFVFF